MRTAFRPIAAALLVLAALASSGCDPAGAPPGSGSAHTTPAIRPERLEDGADIALARGAGEAPPAAPAGIREVYTPGARTPLTPAALRMLDRSVDATMLADVVEAPAGARFVVVRVRSFAAPIDLGAASQPAYLTVARGSLVRVRFPLDASGGPTVSVRTLREGRTALMAVVLDPGAEGGPAVVLKRVSETGSAGQ